MWIARKIEATLLAYAGEFPVVIVTGARQAGKTSLLVHLFPEMEYVTLDDPADAARAEVSPREFLGSLPVPVIIDEVQYAPSLFRFLKSAVDRRRKPGSYFLTGSQQFPLMRDAAESLAGRAGVLHLPTLAAEETTAGVKDYVIRGGYPGLYGDTVMRPEHWFPSYISTYLERDVRNLLNVGSLRDYYRFVRALALRTGRTLSLSDLARDVGVAPNTIKSWVSVLQRSGLVFLLEPFHRNAGKRLVKSPKVYLTDTGLACHLMGIGSWAELASSPLFGAVWESYVFNQLYRHFLNRGIPNPPLWFWRTQSGDEVDFLVERGGRMLAVEAKAAGQPRDTELAGFRRLRGQYGDGSIIRQLLVCPVPTAYPMPDGTMVTDGIDLDRLMAPDSGSL